MHQFLQKYRVLLSRIIFTLLVIDVFGYLRIPIQPFDAPLGLAGLLLIALGVGVRSLSAGVLHKNDILATEGIYAMVRNPLYFGSLLLLLGVNLIIFHWLVLLVTLGIFALTYVPTILREEVGLAQKYGDAWHAYVASTPRILPNPLRLSALRGMQWSGAQWYRNHEHNTLIAALVIIALLEAYRRYWALA